MKHWKDAQTYPELRSMLDEALQQAGSVTEAAALLGISRRHLTRLLAQRRETSGTRETHETACLTEPKAKRRRLQNIRAADTVTTEKSVRISIDIPEPLLHWIEYVALEWKHAGRTERVSKGAVVLEALRRYKATVDTVVEAVTGFRGNTH